MSEPQLPLRPYVELYMREYVKKGNKLTNIKYVLEDFLDHLSLMDYRKDYIDRGIFESWTKTFSTLKPNTRYAKTAIARRFLVFLSSLGNDSYIPVLPRKRDSGYIPYVYTPDEVDRIFQCADSLRSRERHPESIMMSVPVILRLLYSTGLRISEALSINNSQVDFERHLILLEITKNGHQRIAVLTPTMENEIKKYIRYRNLLGVKRVEDPESPLFVSGLGRRCGRNIVCRYFHRILDNAGITRYEDGPCLHGLRHASCVHAFAKMIRADKDPYAVLPILSAFMGHRKMLDTEMYLRLTRQMYPDLIKWDADVIGPINEILKEKLKEYEEEQ